MTPDQLKAEAESLRLALIEGRTTVEKVVSWADNILQNTADIPYEFIDIASSENCSVADMVSKLSSVPG